MKNFATYNSLMKKIRENGIYIKGSINKRHLYLTGYFHGYKGYRYLKQSQNIIPFDDYNQIIKLIDFDENIKSILYLPLMRLECAIKSICCDKIVTTIKSNEFSIAYNKIMPIQGNNSIKKMNERMKCRNQIYSSMTKRYNSSSQIVPYYYNQDRYVPLWEIIEELTLGELASLINTLSENVKLNISKELGIPQNYNTNGKQLHRVIIIVKELRNAIAHNRVIFDGRYKESKRSDKISIFLIKLTNIPEINWDSTIDDVILIFFLLKELKFEKAFLLETIQDLINETQKIYDELGPTLYRKIFPQNALSKLQKLKKYLKKN